MREKQKKHTVLIGLSGGLFVGFLNGFFGGGGEMIVVPLLIFLLGLREKEAHATAIFVILPISLVSSVVYLINGHVDYLQLLYSVIGFVAGGILGALLLIKMNSKVVRIVFSLIMIVAGIKMIF